MATSDFGDILSFAKGVCLMTVAGVTGALAVELMYLHPDAIPELLERTQSVEVGATKIAFGEMAFSINPDLPLSLSERQKIHNYVKRLSPNEFDRLMHLTEYDKKHLSVDDLHCDFDKATSRMRLFSAADAGLIEKKLVERIPTTRVPFVHYDPKDKKAVDIGNPSNCYQMVLTDDGRNLKSVLVSELTRAFGNINEDNVANTTTVPKSASAHKQSKEVRSIAQGQREAHLQ
ncbi:MAG TPA: hypothetical protein VIJ25_06570 [Methylococcales bacterium]